MLEKARQYIKNNNIDIILLTEDESEYVDNKTKLKFRCKCGNVFYTRFEKIRNRKKHQCNECGLILRGLAGRVKIEDVIKLFEKNNLIPLFNTYNSCYEKLKCKTQEGYIGFVSYAKLKGGYKFDMCSKYNPYSIYNINHFIKINNLSCKLLSTEYNNASEKLRFMCGCGREYLTSSRSFKYFKIQRCRLCSRRQSSLELAVEQYLKSNNIKYMYEYRFDDCRNVFALPFDFAILNKENKPHILIEVDGEGHYECISTWGGENHLNYVKYSDSIKTNYCKSKNIKLIRIPHWDIKNGKYKKILDRELKIS